MKNRLMQALPIVASMLGRKLGVRVVIGGREACTNGNTIRLPALPPEADDLVPLVRGYLDHESGHVRFTDFGPFAEKDDVKRNILNIIEDVRIERQMGEIYPGCRVNLNELYKLMAARKEDGSLFVVPDADAPPNAVLFAYLVQKCRADVLQQEIPLQTVAQTEAVFIQAFGAEPAFKLEQMLKRVGGLRNTDDAYRLAQDIHAMLCDFLPPPPQMGGGAEEQGEGNETGQEQRQGAQGSSGGSQADPNQSESQSSTSEEAGRNTQGNQGAGATPGSKDPTPQPAGDQDNGQGEKSRSRSEGQSSRQGEPDTNAGGTGSGQDQEKEARRQRLREALNPQAPPMSVDTMDAVRNILNEAAQRNDAISLSDGMCDPHDSGSAAASGDAPGNGAGSDMAREGLTGTPVPLEQALAVTAGLRSRVQRLLQSKTLVRSFPGRTGTRIVQDKLSRVMVGDSRIFRQSVERKGYDTLIGILVDRSGSMNGSKLELAMLAALASASAFEQVKGVRVCVGAFPGHTEWVVPITRVGASVRRTAGRYVPKADGGTPMAEAMWSMARAMGAEREKRKLLLVVTDGQPDDPGKVTQAVQLMRSARWEVMGIGIGVQCGHLFRPACTLRQIGDLSGAMFDMLQQALNHIGVAA